MKNNNKGRDPKENLLSEKDIFWEDLKPYRGKWYRPPTKEILQELHSGVHDLPVLDPT